MQTRFILRVIAAAMLVFFVGVQAAVVTRITTFSDGSILYASDLNAEFNNLVDNINNLDNDNLSTSANISPSKINATIAGSGIVRDSSTGALAVNPDGTTLELSGDTVQVKDDGISVSKIAEQAALSVLGNGTNATANVTAITAGSDGYVLRRSGTAVSFGTIVTAGIADDAITQAKLGAANYGISSSCGNGSYTNATTGYTDVTNLSVTITTTGRPIEVTAVSDASGNEAKWNMSAGNVSTAIKALRDATEIGREIFQPTVNGGLAQNMASSSLKFVDAPAAGTYTYKLQAKGGSGSLTITCFNIKLYVKEI